MLSPAGESEERDARLVDTSKRLVDLSGAIVVTSKLVATGLNI